MKLLSFINHICLFILLKIQDLKIVLFFIITINIKLIGILYQCIFYLYGNISFQIIKLLFQKIYNVKD